ncbi:MAG: DUF721 domain-containing protein [Mariniblastus sp.]
MSEHADKEVFRNAIKASKDSALSGRSKKSRQGKLDAMLPSNLTADLIDKIDGQVNFEELDFSHADNLVNSRQRFARRPKRMADLLGHLMARKGYGQTETANELQTAWADIVGPKWKTKTKVGTIRRGVLQIMVSSSTVNQHLGFNKKKYLAELQKRMPKNNFKDIRFQVGNVR